MPSQRSAEMARIMMEKWPEGESAEDFVLRRFSNDTLRDLEGALLIFEELENADVEAEDMIRRRQL